MWSVYRSPPNVFRSGIRQGATRSGGSGGGASSVTFRTLDGDSSIANLPSTITANSISVSALERLEAKDATTSLWTAVTGVNLPIASTGTLPTVGLDTALTSLVDREVQFNAGQVYQAGDTTTGDVGTLAAAEDLIVEVLLDYSVATSNGRIIGKRGTTGAGWELAEFNSAGRLQFLVNDGTTTLQAASSNTGLTRLVHIICFLDRDDPTAANSGGIFQNGVSLVAFSTAANTVTGSLSNAKALTVGSGADFANKSSNGVLYAAVYRQANWFPGGAANPTLFAQIANERAARLMGAFPSTALGTAAPSAATRTSTAMVDKVTSGVRRMFPVGPNWTPRLARRTSPVGGVTVTGAILESARTNLLLQSETIDNASWTKTACAVTANASGAPDGSTNADAIIADATTVQHSTSQVVTLTAVSHVFSKWWKAGNQPFLLLEDATLANCAAWFNISAGTVATVGAGVLEARIEAWGGGLFRCSIRFTGTAAAHTLQFSPTSADNVNTCTGDAVTASGFAFGAMLEASDHAGTYVATTTAAATRTADVLSYVGGDGNIAVGTPTSLSLDYLGPNYDQATSLVPVLAGGTTTNFNPNGFSLSVSTTDLATAQYQAASAAQMSTAGTSDITDGEKHTLKLTADVNAGKLFVDGAQQGATDTTLALFVTAPVTIGIAASTGSNALIANVQINSAVV